MSERFVIQAGDYYFKQSKTGNGWAEAKLIFTSEIKDAKLFKTKAALDLFVSKRFPKDANIQAKVLNYYSEPELMVLGAQGELHPWNPNVKAPTVEYDIFDPAENGGREPCDSDEDCPDCCGAFNQIDDWPCIYKKGHTGKHMTIFAIEFA